MTYQELADKIAKMSSEQKQFTVTIYLEYMNEYYPVTSIEPAENQQSVLDEGHPILWVG